MAQRLKKETSVVTPYYLDTAHGTSELGKSINNLRANMVEEGTEDYSPFLKAIRNGHLDEVQSLVNQGANVNRSNVEGKTPLVIAAKIGSVDLLDFLIDQGAEITKSVEGLTALHVAAHLGHLHTIKYLISRGADVKEGDNNGLSALHVAALNGHLDVTTYLISQGAKINKGSNYGHSALHFAAFNGHLDVIEYLASQGAEVNEENDNVTALHIAAQNGHLDVVKYLISQRAEVNKGYNNGVTALHIAAENGHLDVVKYLTSQGAEVNTGKDNGVTALYLAAQNGHLDDVKYLTSQGAEVNKGKDNGETALYIAAQNGHLDVVKYLTSQGAEVNKGKHNGVTALYIAAQNGFLDAVKYLTSQGAEVNKGKHNGVTALYIAAQNGHLDVVKYLISQGAEVNKGYNNGVTALYLAAQNGHLDVVKYLTSQGAEVNKGYNNGVVALYIAAQNGHLDVVKYLISQGAEVNKGKDNGVTALHIATESGHLDVVKYLTSQGAEVNKGYNNGVVALHIAAQNGHLEVVKYLISKGAEVNAKNKNGLTSLDLARSASHLDVVQVLKAEGESRKDERSLNSLYLTILAQSLKDVLKIEDIHVAIQHGQTTAIERLVSRGADVNVQSADGNMCLHEAIKLCYNSEKNVEESNTLQKISEKLYDGNLSPEKALVYYLLENGAKTDVEDRSGKLPIHYAQDEVIKQMILSRMNLTEKAHYYQENTDTERPENLQVSTEASSGDFTPPPQDVLNPADNREQSKQIETQTQSAEKEGDHTDGEYDLIKLKKHDIMVRMSKYEIYSAKDITVEVIEDVPPELKLKETEAIISVGLKMSPSDAIFDSPVIVTMPHCGVFTKPEQAEVFIYYRNNGSTGFQAIHSTRTSNPRCIVRDYDLDIFLDHFSEFWIGGIIGWLFPAKRLYCTPCIPVPALRNEDHMVYVHLRDASIKESEILKGYEAPILEEEFQVWWGCGGLEITFKESPTEKAKILKNFYYVKKEKVMFEVETRNFSRNTMLLHFILEQWIRKEFIVPMTLSDEVPTSASNMPPVNNPSSSSIPHPVTLATTADSRAPMEESDDFGDILREIARKVRKRQDVDELGCKLEFNPSEIESYYENNTNGSYMGTLQMLRVWRERTKNSEERELLRNALIAIRFTQLSDELLSDGKQG